MKRFIFFTVAVLLTLYSFGSEEEPLWVRINKGKSAIDRGQLGEAAFIFREILKDNKENPEAEKWLGFIFEQEGEYELAIRQFEKTLENQKALTVLEDRYFVMYHLGRLYRETGRKDEYKAVLEKIIDDAESEKVPSREIDTMIRVVETKGIDKFFELYRPEGRITQKAHFLLGEEYFAEKNYKKALKHLILAAGVPVSILIEEIKKDYPLYSFTVSGKESPFEDFLVMVNKNRRFREYADESGLYYSLYYAGVSVYMLGYKETGRDIIYFVMTFADNLPLKNKARLFYTGGSPVQISP